MLIDEATIDRVKILLVVCACWRCRLYDAAGARAPAPLPRRAPHLRRRTAAAEVVLGNPHLNQVVIAPKRRGIARRPTIWR